VVDPFRPYDTHTFIDSMSCINTSFCVAADGNERTLQWNGRKWFFPQLLSAPVSHDSYSIDCTSTRFCMALGGLPIYVATWNGKHWTASKLNAISCTASGTCEVVDAEGNFFNVVQPGLGPRLPDLCSKIHSAVTAV
jgi:hypothetical protein